MNTKERLIDYIERFVSLTEEEKNLVRSAYHTKQLEKKEFCSDKGSNVIQKHLSSLQNRFFVFKILE